MLGTFIFRLGITRRVDRLFLSGMLSRTMHDPERFEPPEAHELRCTAFEENILLLLLRYQISSAAE